MILLNPKKHNREYPDDERSKEIMLKTIDFFEKKGLAKIKEDDHGAIWYRDFLDFVKKEKLKTEKTIKKRTAKDIPNMIR